MLDEFLAAAKPSQDIQLSQADLERFFWKYKGLQKQWERANAFWSATNDNLKTAYEKLDEQEQELARAYDIIQDDLIVASQIQTSLLPQPTEQIQNELEIAIYHHQLTEVGGDYYDFFITPNQRYAIGVFDISGHGVAAALVMTYIKAQFMQTMERLSSPKAIVERVNNRSLAFLRDVKKYATVNFVVVREERLQYVCGGGFGLLLHQGDIHTFHKGDPFLGLRPRPYTQYELPFTSGDLLALYTDGITESQDRLGHDYSVKRLNDLIQQHRDKPVQAILDLCLADYNQFKAQDSDDVTLLIIRKK